MTVPIDAVVSHHLDGFRSGVARFNELLAARLGIPVRGLFEPGALASDRPLLSFKVSELSADEIAALDGALDESGWKGDVFLHELSGHPLERRLVATARRVLCGNREILRSIHNATGVVVPLWTPGLVLDDRPIRPAEITVFSFGMAHKIRTDMFRRLRVLLDATDRSYAIFVSSANHETSSIRDAEIVFHEMHEIFPQELYFLGNLSDVAVSHYLRQATFFAAFFAAGIRDNNTSVSSALERGCVVITNLDDDSPPAFAHLDSVIDIEQCDRLPVDDLTLARLRVRALEVAHTRTWDRLVGALREPIAP